MSNVSEDARVSGPAEQSDAASWRPILLEATEDDKIAELLASGQVHWVHDRLDDQLEELITSREPGAGWTAERLAAAKEQLLDGLAPERYGTWVFYPWSGRLVHVLPEAEFREVRGDRNRDKLTREEQRSLARKRIGVVGLSVGNSAALTCALEGIGGSYVLADHDTMSLSNLNRLRAGVADLGVPKTVLCARQMLEIDPYLEIHLIHDGLTEASIAEFFAGGLDLVIEECDTPWAKIAVREWARAHRTPVLMDTNDRGLIDIERFDEEPDRPLMHGRIGDITADDLNALDRAGQVAVMVDMVDATSISPAMTEALGRIGVDLSSWPQLASGVMLGGALVADTARRILTGHAIPSGRHYIDLDQLIPVSEEQP